MHTIAICDDDTIFLNKITDMAHSYFTSHSEPADIHKFSNGEDFIVTLDSIHYSLILLDIDMPGKSGMEVSKLLRDREINASIIFISSHETYVFQSLHYQPLRFIRKDHICEELVEGFQAYRKEFFKEEPLYTFKAGPQNLIVPIKEIIYLDVYTHNTTVHCLHDTFQIRKTLNFFESELKAYGFIRIHQSYLVSYRFIYSIHPTSLVLTNKQELPISRGKNEFIKEQYMHFYREIN